MSRTATTPSNDVEGLIALLGKDALLLPCKSKKSLICWSDVTPEKMKTAKYRAWLAKAPSIAALLGERGGGLCVVDWDMGEFVEPFVAANRHLQGTLTTRGVRGQSFWVRSAFAGACPEKTIKLKSASGEDAGEFRSGGAISIVAGLHPSGKLYEILVDEPPVEIEFRFLKWPAGVTPRNTTVSPLGSHESSEFPVSPVLQLKDLMASDLEQRMIRQCIPAAPHQNHSLLFNLARVVKSIEKKERTPLNVVRLKSIFDRWYEQSIQFLRADQTRDDYFFEFLAALECVKYPMGEGVLDLAWLAAQTATPPPEARVFDSPEMHLLVCLCRELQRAAGNKPFPLAARVVQRLFGHAEHVTSWRRLTALCSARLLKVAMRGNNKEHLANEYRYLLPVEPIRRKGLRL